MKYINIDIERCMIDARSLSIEEEWVLYKAMLYYFYTEKKLIGSAEDISDEIGARGREKEVSYVLKKLFEKDENGAFFKADWDEKIDSYKKRKELGAFYGKKSAESRSSKGGFKVPSSDLQGSFKVDAKVASSKPQGSFKVDTKVGAKVASSKPQGRLKVDAKVDAKVEPTNREEINNNPSGLFILHKKNHENLAESEEQGSESFLNRSETADTSSLGGLEDIFDMDTPENKKQPPEGKKNTCADKEKKDRRKKNSTSIPDNFEITSEHRRLCIINNLEVEREFSKFSEYNKSKDGKYANWDAAFKFWIQRAGEYAKMAQGKNTRSKNLDFITHSDEDYERGLIRNEDGSYKL